VQASVAEFYKKRVMELNTIIYRLPPDYPEGKENRAMYYSSRFFEEETRFRPEPPCEFLGIFFNLGSEIKIQVGSSEHTIGRNQFSIMYLPEACCGLTFTKGKHNSFCIHFRTSYLNKIAGIFPILDGLPDKVEKKIATVLNAGRLVITPEIRAKINDVIHNTYTGQVSELWLESRFIGIIILSLVHREIEVSTGLDETEIEKVRKAHALILRDVQAHRTVGMIADELQISQRKLERGFRILFHTTVYGFIIDERMKKAVALLRDTPRSISEIAKTVGYPSLKTFSKIFKRKFGHPPMQLRKK
jgi:AraC-like DNA-binding protein